MSRRVRLPVAVAGAVLLLAIAAAIALGPAGGDARADADAVRGPGPVTVRLDVDHSRFGPTRVRVAQHTVVRFVVVTHDPIGHELIVGDDEVHARHAGGTEAQHPTRPGEVSVPPGARASTTFTFHEAGVVQFACHLPGHFEYGMKGTVIVEPV
jgi:uncharacterized cupredoxin-like copper-binding protein